MFKILKDLFKVPNAKPKIETPAFDTSTIPEDFEIKYEFKDVKIAGVQYASPDRTELKKGEEVQLIFERKNKYDKKAIKIMQNNIKLGYISKSSTLQGLIHRFYNNNCLVITTLKKINPKNILIDIEFYDSVNNKYRSSNFRLNRIKKSDRENWDFVKSDEILDIEEDDEKYNIVNEFGEPLGTLNKKLSESINRYKDIFCYVEDIDFDYDDEDERIVTSADFVITIVE